MGDAAAFPWFLYIVNPSVNPPYGDCQLPVKGSLLGVFTSPILASLTEGGGFCEAKDGGSLPALKGEVDASKASRRRG